jgi:hypothetical protein
MAPAGRMALVIWGISVHRWHGAGKPQYPGELNPIMGVEALDQKLEACLLQKGYSSIRGNNVWDL